MRSKSLQITFVMETLKFLNESNPVETFINLCNNWHRNVLLIQKVIISLVVYYNFGKCHWKVKLSSFLPPSISMMFGCLVTSLRIVSRVAFSSRANITTFFFKIVLFGFHISCLKNPLPKPSWMEKCFCCCCFYQILSSSADTHEASTYINTFGQSFWKPYILLHESSVTSRHVLKNKTGILRKKKWFLKEKAKMKE